MLVRSRRLQGLFLLINSRRMVALLQSPSALSIAPNYMAVLAQNVIDFCGYEPPFVNGQQADEQDYVVIVADADC